jgi:hypothetical protein
MTEKPAFELIRDNEHIKIYVDGHVEGAKDGEKLIVLNRIPSLMKAEYQRLNFGKLD